MTATAAAITSPESRVLSAAAERIYDGLLILLASGQVAEMRLPETHRGVYSGYFADFEAMASRAADWSGNCPAVYFTLNPVQPELLDRSQNRLKCRPKQTTTNAEIVSRRWLPLDFDPVIPAGISSTDAEHASALAKAQECKAWLSALGWPLPLAGDSGNGANLLYRIELPNDEPSRLLVESTLKALSQKFTDAQTEIDTTVGNAARIWKVYGTKACKGDSSPERPHRASALLEIPAEIQPVTREQLEQVAALATEPAPKKPAGKSQGSPLDVAAWLAKHSIAVASTGPCGDGTKWELADCPLNPEHKKKAVVIQHASGIVSAKCQHESCPVDWKTLREMYEPAPAWRDSLLLTKEEVIKPVLENVLLVLRNESVWTGVLSYNEFNLCTMTQNPAPWMQSRAGAVWTDFDDSQLAAWLQRYGALVNSRTAAEAAQTIAQENPFHPVRNYLHSLVWDGKQRVNTWLSVYLGAANNAYTCAVGGCWLISGVARITRPGCKCDQILLLEGEQGSLKSTALMTLAGAEFFCDHISDIGSKDSRLELAGSWIFELAELDRVRRGELSRIKAFFSAQTDVFRPPYGRRTQRFPRSCIFCATTNDSSPLVDESGNRRWWPVRIGQIDIAALARDRDQLWAEAVTLYEAGEKWWLDSVQLNQIAAKEADLRYSPGLWDEQILNWCDSPEPRERKAYDLTEISDLPFVSSPGRVTISDILVHCIGKPIDKFAYADQAQVQRCLTHDGWQRLPQCRVQNVVGRDNRVRFWQKGTGTK
ncbi:MAG: virulence-associated E family protein [Candidatus Sulfotelmatobacter sp.]